MYVNAYCNANLDQVAFEMATFTVNLTFNSSTKENFMSLQYTLKYMSTTMVHQLRIETTTMCLVSLNIPF